VTCVRTRPCPTCPYRRDVPSGLWARSEYDRLVGYDAPTFAQPTAVFACHSTPDELCHGWAVVHMARGHEHELLALRLRWPDGGVPDAAVPLFESGAAAAAHGLAQIDDPPAAAREAVGKLVRIIERRQDRPGRSEPSETMNPPSDTRSGREGRTGAG
jgi:Family of unknown function (DUF6283)